MKHAILIAMILTASLCYARTPLIVYDPNTVIESPADSNNISIVITVEVTKEQYAAMQYLNISLLDVVDRSNLRRTLDGLILRAKALIVEAWTITELKALKEI